MNYHFYVEILQFGTDDKISELLDEILQKTNHDSRPVYTLDLAWEGFNFSSWFTKYQQFILNLRLAKPNSKIFVIANSHFVQYQDQLESVPINGLLLLDFFLYRTYRELVKFKTSPIKANWHEHSDKFLCLGGRVKPEREKLFDKLQQHDLLKQSVYSFYGDLENSKLKNILQRLDYTGDGLYYTNHFENCLFQIVVETSCLPKTESPWITEKTWVAMMNHNPFIMFGDVGSIEQLKSKGFATFEQYLEIPDYEHKNLDQRLDSLVVNTKHWLKNIQQFQSKIYCDVAQNFSRLESIFLLNLELIETFIDKHKLSIDVDHLVVTDFNETNNCWRIYYNGIRDRSWPANVDFRDFKLLNHEIKKDIFNHDYSFLTLWPQRLREFEAQRIV